MIEIIRNFSSWQEYVSCANDKTLRQYKHLHESHNGKESFTGTKSFQQAIDMALYTGWPEGLKLLSNSIAIIAPKPEPYKSISYDVGGAFPSIPLYLTGDPSHMMNFDTEHISSNPVVRIDYNFSVSAFITTNTIILRGAAVLSLCNTLENKGYSVELRLIENCRGGNFTLRTNTIYKKAGQPLDLDRAAFAIAHPSVLRRFHFCITEQHKELESIFGSGYGYPLHERNDPNPNTIFIPGPKENNSDPKFHQNLVAQCARDYLEKSL